MQTPVITLSEAAKQFGNRTALHPISLQIQPGETVALVGTEDAGKSVLFRVLAGIEELSSGSAILPSQVEIGTAFTSNSPRGVRTPQQWLERVAAQRRIPTTSRPARIAEALDALGLHAHRRELLSEMSDGRRVASAVAAAIVGRPKLILLDSVATSVSPETDRTLRNYLRERCLEGCTIVRVEMESGHAWGADRILMMHRGKAVAFASPTDLLAEFGWDTVTVEAVDPTRVRRTIRGKFDIRIMDDTSGVLTFSAFDGEAVAAELFRTGSGGLRVVHVSKPNIWELLKRAVERTKA